MTSSNSFLTSLQVNLRDKHNGTYRGQLLLKNNWTLTYGGSDVMTADPDVIDATDDAEDDTGASYYIIAVVFVYGMSIVMLIASHINRKHTKIVEDRQIHKYLQEFQIVKERSSQESYKDLKKKIKEQIHWDKEHSGGRHNMVEKSLSQAMLPMIAVTVPIITDAPSLSSLNHGGGGEMSRSRASSRSSLGAPPSSPGSQPRSRTSSIGELSAPSRFGRFLTPPEPSDMRVTSPKLTRTRRKGLAHLFSTKHVDAHHLEKILEESLESRQGSFRRKDSKKSLRSNHSNSVGSLHELARPPFLPEFVIQEQAEKHNSALELPTGDDAVTPEAPSSDSGVMNQSCSNTPDVVIAIPEDDDNCDNETTHLVANRNSFDTNTDDVRETYISEDETEWAINTDSGSDDEEQNDEAYESGRYIAHALSPASLPSSAYAMAQSRAKRSRDHRTASQRTGAAYCRQCRPGASRLSPLHDVSLYYSDTSSSSADDTDDDDDDQAVLYITTV